MSRDWVTTGIWGLFLLGLTVLLLGWERSWLQLLLLGGSAALVLAGAALLRPLDEHGRATMQPETSLGTIVLAGGITLALLGLAFGTWLLLPGLGLVALGAGAALRELRR